MKKLLFLCMTTLITLVSHSQTVLPLYTDSIPNSKPVPDEEKSDTDENGRLHIEKVSHPTLTVYLPPKEKANGAAVVVCPGGGYRFLAYTHEGIEICKRFNEMGITAF